MKGQFPAILPLASLNGKNGFKLDGEATGDYSGYSVSTAGDINGDGYSDLLIGAPQCLTGACSGPGRSYVMFGGAGVGGQGLLALSSLNGTNGFKLDGEATGDYTGYSVSAAGDVNGDGYADLLIGSPQCYVDICSGPGLSYVVFGSAVIGRPGLISLSALNGTNGFKLGGEVTSDHSGFSVSTAGDINKDGYADLLIGAENHANPTGRSYVILGGAGVGSQGLLSLSSLNGMNGFKLDGQGTDASGWSVSGAGDVNGDGYADLLIGAPFYTSSTGHSYVVFGGPTMGSGSIIPLSGLNGVNGFTLDSEVSGDQSGRSVSTAGDINSDGYSDLLIGAWGHASYTGRSYVVFGGAGIGNSGNILLSSLNGANGFKLNGGAINDYSGWSASAAGDVNGDGYADLLIGAYGHANNTGCSYVVFGGTGVSSQGLLSLSTLDGMTGFTLNGEVMNDQGGYSVNTAGDINGDGVADILIGAYEHSSGTGRSYVVFGDIPPVLVNNSLSLSVGATIQLNSSCLAAYDRNHNNNTLVFVLSGVSHGQFEMIGAPGIPLVNFTQQQVTSGAIQFVHDGTLVAPSYNITVRSTGIAWVGPLPAQINFIGAPQSYFPAVLPLASLNGQNGFKIDGEMANDLSGTSVSAARDVNGDGYHDLLIGAPQCCVTVTGTGRSYLIYGGPAIGQQGSLMLNTLNGTNGFKILGEVNGSSCGFAVRSTGDVNGDGYPDMLIGSPNYNVAQNGRSYLIFGNSKMGNTGVFNLTSFNSSNVLKMDGESEDKSGYAVSSAGDMNGDGYADLVIGAPGTMGSQSYVVFGNSSVGLNSSLLLSNLNGVNGFKINGETNFDQSGYSVNGVGDINADGYDDLLIGAPYYGGQNGRSYVVFGDPGVVQGGLLNLTSLNGSNGFKLYGESYNEIGYSVSGAGDVNGDGYSDLLIGGPRYNNFGISYVVYGSHGLGQTGSLNLTQLTSSEGFQIEGEQASWSGYSVNAGDFNGDGYSDLIMGGAIYAGDTGRSYVVFGGSHIAQGSIMSLASLDGMNGFKLDGENLSDWSGSSVSGTGDINGDGVDDMIIGAPNHNSTGLNSGRTYVVFGDIPPILVQNRLTLSLGSSVVFNSTLLSAYDRNNNNNTIIFVPSNVTHGYFELMSQPGVAVTNFTQPELINGSVQFVHDGSVFAPSYNITVYSAGIAWTGPSAANITFVPITTPIVTTSSTIAPSTSTPRVTTGTPTLTPTSTPSPTPTSTVMPTPVLLNNQLTISNGQTVMLSSANLQAVETGFNVSNLIFYVSNVLNGYFSTAPIGNNVVKNLTSFTQAQIQNGAIEFVSVGNKQAPSYSVIVSDGMQTTSPSTVTVSFTGAPVITQNMLNITTGATITLTPAMLNVTAPSGIASNQVSLSVNDLQHATMTSTLTKAAVSNFTLADVQAGDIQLTQDGSLITPSYTITATVIPTTLSSTPDSTDVLFSNQGVYAPQLVNNYLVVTQGKTTTLSNRYLSAQEPPKSQPLGNTTMFYMSDIEYGHFSLVDQPQVWITSFNQQQLLEGQVQFVQDGSSVAPGYKAAVLAFGLQSASLPASIFFTPANVPAPILEGNSGYTTIQKAIIGAVISGTMGILFAVLQACLKRAANRKLLQALGDSTEQYDLTVVRPVAREIARQIKVTGCMNHTTNTKMAHFKSAVRKILFELAKRGVDLNFAEMNSAIRDGIINEIAGQTRRIVLGDPGCCQGFVSFFKAQATPKAIENAAVEIAAAVAAAVQTIPATVRNDSVSVRMVELPSLSDSKEVLLMANRSSSQVVPPDSSVRIDTPKEQQAASQVLGA